MRHLLLNRPIRSGLGYPTTFPRIVFNGREDFGVPQAAPLAGVRSCNPGPGTLDIRDNTAQCSISGGDLIVPASATFANPGARIVDLNDVLFRLYGQAAWYEMYYTVVGDLRLNIGLSSGSYNTSRGFFITSGTFQTIASAGPLFVDTGEAIPAINTPFRIIVITRQVGTYYILSVSPFTTYKVLRIHDISVADVLGIGWVNGFTTSTTTRYLKNMWHVDLIASGFEAPWGNQYGLATARYAGAVVAGQVFSHEADCWIHWTQTALPTGITVTSVRFRQQDATNYWEVRILATGNLELWEYVAGVGVLRGTAVAAVAAGNQIRVLCDAARIRIWAADVYLINYTLATNFQTATAGKLETVGTAGAVSDLIVSSCYLSGVALSSMQAIAAA